MANTPLQTEKIYIKTFGCSANQNDSEIMAGILKQSGYELTNSINSADIIVVNTCTVKNKAENEEIRLLAKLKADGKKIIVTGCLVQDKQHLNLLKGISFVGLSDQDKMADYVKAVAAGKLVSALSNRKIEHLGFPTLKSNPIIEKIQIATGCANKCAYCATKLARGDIYSFSEARILAQVESAIGRGAKEIWLTSQDNGAYGLDRKTNVAKLLQKICELGGTFFIRVGMANPQHIIRMLPELIEAYKNPKVFKFLHIPVQSGSDKVLKAMKRGYTIADFKQIITAFRKAIPEITISTDVICGFPGETDEDFGQTLDLVRWLKPDVINISQFWPRPGTSAAKMPQLHGEIKKERSRKLTKLYAELALKANKKLIGKKFSVLIDEKGSKGGFVGRNMCYRPVVIKNEKLTLGDSITAKIISATKNYLLGEI